MHFGTAWVLPGSNLDVSKSSFVQTEVVSEFVEHGLPDFMTDFGVVRADRLDMSLVEDEAVRSGAKVERALLRGRHTLKNAQNQTAGPAAADFPTKPARFLAHPWPILNQYREIVDPLSDFQWE